MNRTIKIGPQLREYREQTGKNQAEFAALCDMNVVQYRRYENDKSEPRKEQLKKIITALNSCNVKNKDGFSISFADFSTSAIIENWMVLKDDTPVKRRLDDYYYKLNHIGQVEAEKRVEELTHIEKYTKKDPD